MSKGKRSSEEKRDDRTDRGGSRNAWHPAAGTAVTAGLDAWDLKMKRSLEILQGEKLDKWLVFLWSQPKVP